MTASYMDARLLGFLAALMQPGVRLVTARVEERQCEFCGDVGALTVVRVNGRPALDCRALHPVEMAESCGVCAPALIARALAEQSDTAGDLVVEVAA
jgi:hypothetical protein